MTTWARLFLAIDAKSSIVKRVGACVLVRVAKSEILKTNLPRENKFYFQFQFPHLLEKWN